MRITAILLIGLIMAVTAFAETQAEHDKRTNYDGYGSEHNRYQNAILMKTHDSILKGGKMEYWSGIDDYYYKKNRGKRWVGQHRGKGRGHR
jgi:hypothetical protein